MIGDAVLLIRDRLNEHLNALSGATPDESPEDRVVLLDGEKMEPLSFKQGAVSVLLINIEQETTLRAPDTFRRVLPDGSSLRVQPDIHLGFYLLFVARFKKYEQGLNYLSAIIQYFQTRRVLTQENAPGLSPDIGKLVFELVTLPFAEQNEVWSALRTTYHPSVLYRVRMITFRDREATEAPELIEPEVNTAP